MKSNLTTSRSNSRQIHKKARGLTPRELEVLATALEGKSGKEIAVSLKISEHTVGDYIKQIYKHFGVKTRAELMACFIPDSHREKLLNLGKKLSSTAIIDGHCG